MTIFLVDCRFRIEAYNYVCRYESDFGLFNNVTEMSIVTYL